MAFDIDSVIAAALEDSRALGKTLFKNFAEQAADGAKNFLEHTREGIARAGKLFAEGKIDKEDLEDLVLGKKDLAAMHALKQAGLATAAIDTFTNGVLNILLNAVFSAVKL